MRPHFPHGPAHDEWLAEILIWTAIGVIVLLNLAMMWRIATATV